MDREKILELQKRVKFCIKHEIPVQTKYGTFVPEAIVLRYTRNEWRYTVELHDIQRRKSSYTEPLDGVDWPTEGGGFVCVK